ncbi:hypothetical protein F5Y06DRAFT_137812 [Hypoxylon sp. FL0890]|nr:hypothetical protein F5Y06DRAFT_137812 [Hypoxylon sp. FL0890]
MLPGPHIPNPGAMPWHLDASSTLPTIYLPLRVQIWLGRPGRIGKNKVGPCNIASCISCVISPGSREMGKRCACAGAVRHDARAEPAQYRCAQNFRCQITVLFFFFFFFAHLTLTTLAHKHTMVPESPIIMPHHLTAQTGLRQQMECLGVKPSPTSQAQYVSQQSSFSPRPVPCPMLDALCAVSPVCAGRTPSRRGTVAQQPQQQW